MTVPEESMTDFPDANDLPIGDPATLIEKIIDGTVARVLPHATTRSVYGEPINQAHRTIIPVANINHRYGFGAGGGYGIAPGKGSELEDNEADGDGGSGGGGGGGGGGQLNARPVGYIEITPEGTTFVPIVDRTALLTAIMPFVGLAILVWAWRLSRR